MAQSGLLAMKDPVSPLGAVLIMCVVNCIGDALMVGQLHWGLAGIAAATVAAQYRYARIHCRYHVPSIVLSYSLPTVPSRSALAVLLVCWARRDAGESPFAVARFPTVAGMNLDTPFQTLTLARGSCTRCLTVAVGRHSEAPE